MAEDEDTQQNAPETEGPLSRRRIVVGGLAAVGAAAVAVGSLGRAANAMSAQQISDKVVVADASLCVGCLACEVNCSTWHASVGRSAVPRIRVLVDATVKMNTQLVSYLPNRTGFTPQTCKQCYTPWCLPNCPTQGLKVDPATGDRYIDESQCIACGKCAVDCPVEWNGTLAYRNQPISNKRVLYDPVKNVFNKCDLCIGRDGGPICVERCPVNAAVKAGYIKSDHGALELKPSTEAQWKQLA